MPPKILAACLLLVAGAAGQNQQSSPALRGTLNPAVFKSFGDMGDGQSVILDLNLMHLQPSALDDVKLFNYFVRLNNCGNRQTDAEMKNEFDYPQIAAFYKENAAKILNVVPSALTTLTFPPRGYPLMAVALGQYDTARKVFPFMNPGAVALDHFDISLSRGALGPTCPMAQTPGAFNAAALAMAGLAVYGVSFKPISFKEIPMDEAAARKYVESLGAKARVVLITVELEISQEPPQVVKTSGKYSKLVFACTVKKVTAFKANTGGPMETLAVLFPN